MQSGNLIQKCRGACLPQNGRVWLSIRRCSTSKRVVVVGTKDEEGKSSLLLWWSRELVVESRVEVQVNTTRSWQGRRMGLERERLTCPWRMVPGPYRLGCPFFVARAIESPFGAR